jgi:hypothetical protein
MKLKDRFDTPIMRHDLGRNEYEETKEQCEQIADEFAIEFAEWLSEKERTKFQCKSYCKKITMWFTDKKGLGATTKELLEQFKKENGN